MKPNPFIAEVDFSFFNNQNGESYVHLMALTVQESILTSENSRGFPDTFLLKNHKTSCQLSNDSFMERHVQKCVWKTNENE